MKPPRTEVNLDPWNAQAELDEFDADPQALRGAMSELQMIGWLHPDLCEFGWHCPNEETCGNRCQGCPGGRRGRRIYSCPHDYYAPDFYLAKAWIRRLERSKSMRYSSYGWKHIYEFESASRRDFYIPIGVFIAAAIAAGIRQERVPDSPNSVLGLRPPPFNFERNILAGQPYCMDQAGGS